MTYIKPGDVVSPKTRWQLIDVLRDCGSNDCAYALGKWDGEMRIGMRWNGNDDNTLGNPQSRGLATWTMLPEELHGAVIGLLTSEKKNLVKALLP